MIVFGPKKKIFQTMRGGRAEDFSNSAYHLGASLAPPPAQGGGEQDLQNVTCPLRGIICVVCSNTVDVLGNVREVITRIIGVEYGDVV